MACSVTFHLGGVVILDADLTYAWKIEFFFVYKSVIKSGLDLFRKALYVDMYVYVCMYT